MRPKRSRYAVTALIVLLVFGVMIFQLYRMQIISGTDYVSQVASKITKRITLTGMRGTIYDCNMIPLAYDKRSYNVQFERDPSRSTAEDRAAYTQSLITVIDLVESNGKSTIGGFWLKRDEEDNWVFDTGATTPAAAATREKQWRQNFYLTDVPVEKLFDTLCENYAIPKGMSEEEKLKVLSIWQEQRMNNYLSKPVTIAYDVDFETVSEIEVRSMDLMGISIQESSTRVYPKGSLASHTVGYVSKISGDETMASYRERGYPNDATVGQTGIEYSMEDQLSPYVEFRQGERVVEINNLGKVVRELGYRAPVDGSDIVLTIDSQLQAVMEEALETNIRAIAREQEKIMSTIQWQKSNRQYLSQYAAANKEVQIAQTGAAVAMDPNSGRVLAIASFPDYDLSMFEGVVDPVTWNELVTDERNPMYNRAISSREMPGSIFKPVTALGGLMEGVLTLDETISDLSPYTAHGDPSHQPSCWIGRSNRWKHANQTVVEGIAHSCNYFFYEVGHRLGSENITKWSAALGLTSRTGIELPNESTSFVGNQNMLYDPSRAIDDQYTSKPWFSAWMIKRMFRRIGVERGIEYDEERLDAVAKKLIDIVSEEGDKSTWPAKIRNILLQDMNLPVDYVSRNFLGNEIQSYINDLRWTPSETIMAAIGQSITQVTPIAVARYISAFANNGTVYGAQVIDKIISSTGTVILDKEPVVVNRITGAGAYMEAIREGMKEVTSVENDGTAASTWKNFKYPTAVKTGTSQKTDVDIENNSWLITFAPYDNPQIVVVVYIQNGYGGAYSSLTAKRTIQYYLDSKAKTDSATVYTTNRLAD